MKIIVSGGSGFIGRRLVEALLAEGHYVAVWSRTPRGEKRDGVATFFWDPMAGEPSGESLEGFDAVVHLAGEPIAQRWSVEAKRKIRESRVLGTERLVAAMGKVRRAPSVLVCASAIGYYGSRGEEELTEVSAAGTGLLAETCVAWEGAAAVVPGVRVVHIRIGVVLGKDGGALAAMRPAFDSFLGGRMGNGRQWMSWIHVDDVVAMLKNAAENSVSGVWNGTAPEPVRNSGFTAALGKALGKPAFLQVPEFVLRAAMGDMAEVVLGSARVLPRAAERAGFRWRYPQLAEALKAAL